MLHHRFFFLMIRRPPRSTLFPYTTLFRSLKENAKSFSPEKMAPVCGVPAQTIREVARLYATSKGSMILWGMGISQHVHGDRKSTRLNSSHSQISYAVFCLKKKKPDCSPPTARSGEGCERSRTLWSTRSRSRTTLLTYSTTQIYICANPVPSNYKPLHTTQF